MIRLLFAIWLGKLIHFSTRLLKQGGGSAAPGYYALKIDPKLVAKLAPKIPQNIIITGTNGKTTTARLLNHLLTSQNLTIIRNTTGSNLERGVASTLISNSSLFGQIKAKIGIWEADEAAFNKLVSQIKPQKIIFLNALRDQLDRYGEVDSVVKNWQASLAKVTWKPQLFVNGNDGNLIPLLKLKNVTSQLFEVVGHNLKYEKANPSSKSTKFQAAVTKNLGLKGNQIKVTYPGGTVDLILPLPGIYQLYDFLAAFVIYHDLKLPVASINKALTSFSPAFGRVEQINLGSTPSFICLIKNPTGGTAVFEMIEPEVKKGDHLLLALNDNFADGTDVSWIWDAEFESLGLNKFDKIIVSGQRAEDLAVRLKYAEVPAQKILVINDLEKALNLSRKTARRLFILPTYTALLNLQKMLVKNSLKPKDWAEI